MTIEVKPTVVLFSSYFNEPAIPYYVRFYLEELRRHFDEVVFLKNDSALNEESLRWLESHAVQYRPVANEGYDFGMWYKALQEIDPSSYSEVALVNDSCILFRRLDEDMLRIRQAEGGYVGMVASNRFAPHIQSFFVVIKESVISKLVSYFRRHGIVRDYRDVIFTYEIGLPVYLASKGVVIEGLYNRSHRDFPENPSFARLAELIGEGLPMIKKKIVFRNYRGLEYYWLLRMNFSYDYRKYFRLIRDKYRGQELIDLDRVMADAPRKHHRDILLFNAVQSVWNLLHRIPGVPNLLLLFARIYRRVKPRPRVNLADTTHE